VTAALWSPFPVLAEVCSAWNRRKAPSGGFSWRPCTEQAEPGSQFCTPCARRLITWPEMISPAAPDEVKHRTADAPIGY
jgi:hypothetical protein